MSRQEEIAQGVSKKGSKRGSAANGKRLAAFSTGKSEKRVEVDWGSCDPRWIQAVIVAMGRVGGLISFGLSRDRGAYSLTLLLDGEREVLWFNGDADIDLELEKVYATLESMR